MTPVDARWTMLRTPFPPESVGRLPRQMKRDDGSKYTIWLDYVGHAACTDRLLQVDPEWTWEPMGSNPDGTPALDANGGLWIRLTVCGVTRPGYGDAQGKSGGNAVKEAIGDAIRNAAMRFGVALDLWSKEDLSRVETPPSDEEIDEWAEDIRNRIAAEDDSEALRQIWMQVNEYRHALPELRDALKQELTARAEELKLAPKEPQQQELDA